MGRPKIVEGGDPLYQRRYPQISNALKRLPSVQETYESSRTPAVLLKDHWATSTHPITAATEGVEDSERPSDDSSIDRSHHSHRNTTVTNNSNPLRSTTESILSTESPGSLRTGGTLVHARVDAHDSFAWTVTHWETFPHGEQITPSGLWEWAMELRAWQDHQSDATRRSRTSKKRKHMSLPPCLLTNHAAKRTTPSSSTSNNCIHASDEEEAAWTALQQHHGGNVLQALLHYTATWGDGDAAEAVTANHGYAWREFVRFRRCLRTGVYCSSTSYTGAAAASLSQQQQHYTSTKQQQHHQHVANLTADWDDLVVKETWEAVLNCARLCTETRVSLSALSAFLTHATYLREASETVVSREVNTTMNSIVHKYIQGRVDRAKLLDLWYDCNGVNIDEIKALMDSVSSSSSTTDNAAVVVIDELEEMRRQLRIVAAWQQRVNALCNACNTNDSAITDGNDDDDHDCWNDLDKLEALDREGSQHGFRSKGHIELKNKLESIYQLQVKIAKFCRKRATVKSIAALVRDVHRIGVKFPAAHSLLRFHKTIEAWLAEATAANRSVAPIENVRSLFLTGGELPISLQDHMDKLSVKLKRGEAWLETLYTALDYHGDDFCTISQRIQGLLGDDATAKTLNELIQESNTLPVRIGYVNLLEIEMDAHQWTVQAQIFMDTKTEMEKLKTHCEAAEALRKRLQVYDEQRAAWTLPLEHEIKNLVMHAYSWTDRVVPILGSQKRISTMELLKLKDEGNSINADLGAAGRAFDCVVAEAKSWYDEHYMLLDRIESGKVTFDELKDAEVAAKDIAARLLEVEHLEALVKRVQRFHDGACVVLGDKRGAIISLDELESLRDAALKEPVNFTDINARLSIKVEKIKEWKKTTVSAGDSISKYVMLLRGILENKFGAADQFKRDSMDKEIKTDDSNSSGSDSTESSVDLDAPTVSESVGVLEEIRLLIREFHRGAKDLLVATQETRFADLLYRFNQWIEKSLKYLQSQRDVFDKRFFGAFDRFLTQGQELANDFLDGANWGIPAAQSCNSIVSDQMKRFRRLLEDRNSFVGLCQRSKQAISGSDRQLTLEQLVKLSNESESFPNICSEINSIRRISKDASALVQSIRPVVEKRSRIPLDEACTYLQKAKKIGFVCQETRLLNEGVKAARSWARRVQRLCKETDPDPSKVKTLIVEYDGLMIDMADDVVLLEKSQTRYCLCQQAHKGFMVCCQECEDWFHGTCVGVTEKSAKKRFVCLRCNIVKTYELTAANTATLVRKWSSVAELKKARLADLKKLTLKESRQRQSLSTIQSEKASLTSCMGTVVPYERTPATEQSNKGISAGSQQQAASKVDQSTNSISGNPPGASADLIPIAPTTKPFSAICATMTISLSMDPNLPSVVSSTPKSHVASTPANEQGSSIALISQEVHSASCPKAVQPQSCPDKASAAPATPEQVAAPQSSTGTSPQHDSVASSSALLSKDDIASKIEKLTADEKKWTSRIQETVNQRNELARGFVTEDTHHAALHGWIQRFRSLVFAPDSVEVAKESMPAKDGTLPVVTKQLITDAEKIGIHVIPDVRTIVDNMNCLSWCLRATVVFARQPSLTEVNSLLYSADCLGQISNNNTVKSMKSLSVKVRAWEKLVKDEINPVPTKKGRLFSEEKIQKLLAQCDNLPLRSSYESRLVSVVEDGYNRHCLCGGPSDGRFMIGCDKCNQWYHGCCVGKSSEDMLDNTSWLCPVCSKTPTNMQLYRFHEMYDVDEGDESDDEPMSSPKAPDVNKLWPPIGLFQSDTAQKALGLDVVPTRMKFESSVPQDPAISGSSSAKHSAAFRESHGSAVNRNAPTIIIPSRVPVKATTPTTAEKMSMPNSTSPLQNGFAFAFDHSAPLPPVYHPAVYTAPTRLPHPAVTTKTVGSSTTAPAVSKSSSSSTLPEAERKLPAAGVKRLREETTAESASPNGGLLHSCHPHKIPALNGDGTKEPRRAVDLAGNA